jgi:hypothetical protein
LDASGTLRISGTAPPASAERATERADQEWGEGEEEAEHESSWMGGEHYEAEDVEINAF